MCDEVDDEWMRTFWRMLAEREALVALGVVEPEPTARTVSPIASEPSPKRKTQPLSR